MVNFYVTFINTKMSRIGYKEITIPQGVTVDILDGGDFGYKEVVVTGPKGSLKQSVKQGIILQVENGILKFERKDEAKQTKSYHGLYRSLVNNMIEGVTKGFSRELEIVGIGYRAEQRGNEVVFSLGYSHQIHYVPPAGIVVTAIDQTNVKIEGYDKQLVGEVAAKIRAFRKPEPYKGKGVRYKNEEVKRKSSKSAS